MRLMYYKHPNFGDKLNELIFPSFFPNYFNDDDDIDFFGIGSILGFEMVRKSKRKVIFSSGFAYGKKPIIDNTFDIISLRGPLTAEILKVDKNLAIADGALLLKKFNFKENKKYKYSFMPHWTSEAKFDWKSLCELCDITYISPMENDVNHTIKQILQSEVLISEALHGAIVADAFRVPWIPIKAYGGISNFKWNDWASSMNISFEFSKLPSLFNNNDFTKCIFRERFGSNFTNVMFDRTMYFYEAYKNHYLVENAKVKLNKLKLSRQYLSDENILNTNFNKLLERVNLVKRKYC